MSYAVPKLAYAQTLLTLQVVAISSAITCTFVMTQGFEAYIPIRAIQSTNPTAPPEVRIYRDCGGGFETDPLTATRFVFPLVNSSDKTVALKVDTGIYAIQIMSGSNTATAGVFTQQIVTAIESV